MVNVWIFASPPYNPLHYTLSKKLPYGVLTIDNKNIHAYLDQFLNCMRLNNKKTWFNDFKKSLNEHNLL